MKTPKTSKDANSNPQYVNKITVVNKMGNNIQFNIHNETQGTYKKAGSCYSVGTSKSMQISDIDGVKAGDEIKPHVFTCGCLPNISKYGPAVYYSSTGGTATYNANGTCFSITSVTLN